MVGSSRFYVDVPGVKWDARQVEAMEADARELVVEGEAAA
jgi:hypothetical protein